MTEQSAEVRVAVLARGTGGLLATANHATMDSMIPGVQPEEITELVLATHATMDSMIPGAHHQKTKVSVPVSTD